MSTAVDSETLPSELSAQLRSTLSRSEAFSALTPERRTKIAADLREVLAYLTDEPETPTSDVRATTLDESQKGRVQTPGRMTSGAPIDQVGDDFGRFVGDVDFPNFVSSLIHGVFESIVNSSINQMKAYAEMLEGVVKSTKEFAQTEIQESDAMSFLLSSASALLTLGDDNQLQRREGVDDEQVRKRFGRVPDLDEPAEVRALVDQARLTLAQQRQQMMATLVLMGINRIVVTDGEINAKVHFDVKASVDASLKKSAQGTKAEIANEQTIKQVTLWTGQDYTGDFQALQPGSYNLGQLAIGNDTLRSISVPAGWRVTLYQHINFGGWAKTYDESVPSLPAPYDRNTSSVRVQGRAGQEFSVGISTSSTDDTDTNTERMNAKAQLTGAVQIRFKSETYPLEQFAPAAQADVQGKANDAAHDGKAL